MSDPQSDAEKPAPRHAPWLGDALVYVGGVAVAVGAGLIYVPAGVIVGGAQAVVLGLLWPARQAS